MQDDVTFSGSDRLVTDNIFIFLRSLEYFRIECDRKSFYRLSSSFLEKITNTSIFEIIKRDLPSDMDPYIQENDLPMPNDVYQKQE